MIAHGLTLLRLLLSAPVALGFARPDLFSPPLLLAALVTAIASDSLDGMVARRTGTTSAAGQRFDHAADCLFVTSGLAGAAWAGLVTPWLPVLIVAAFAQYLLDSRSTGRGGALRPSLLGRWNGILYFVPLVVLALGRLEALGEWAGLLTRAGGVIAWLLVVSTLVSMVDRAARKSGSCLHER